MMTKIGDRIRIARKSKKMKQSDLAELLSISTSAIGLYEQNRREPDIDTIVKIAYHLDVSAEYLLGLDNKDSSELTEPDKVLLSVTKYFSNELNNEQNSPRIEETLSEQEKTLLTVFRETTEEGRLEMIAAIISIKKSIEAKRTTNSDTTLA